MSFANIFSQSVAYLLILLTESSTEQKILNLMKSSSSIMTLWFPSLLYLLKASALQVRCLFYYYLQVCILTFHFVLWEKKCTTYLYLLLINFLLGQIFYSSGYFITFNWATSVSHLCTFFTHWDYSLFFEWFYEK